MALEGRLRLGENRLCPFPAEPRCRKIGLVLIDHDLIGARIDFRAELASLHFHVGIAIERLDHAGHTRADRRGCRGPD